MSKLTYRAPGRRLGAPRPTAEAWVTSLAPAAVHAVECADQRPAPARSAPGQTALTWHADDDRCAALAWAASGGMALTGYADAAPLLSPAPAFGLAREVTHMLGRVTGEVGTAVDVDPAAALFGRAGLLGYRRSGQRSAGGASRLLRTADGWCAITLARADDFDSVSALLATRQVDEPWAALESAAPRWSAAALAERAQLLGVPAAALPGRTTLSAKVPPWRTTRIAAPAPTDSLHGRLVVDLSSLWAGPLCARILGAAGARVVKVESTRRRDGARVGDPRFFESLHAGHEVRVIDFRSDSGRTELAALLDAADIVIEASRPRALAQLGLAPHDRPHRPGRVWLSLTGYGRDRPLSVAFGDDAAAAGGLVGWDGDEPVFCGDAVADPLTGLCGALAVACAVRDGGGVLLDLSMRAVAAAFAAAPPLSHGPHHVRSEDGEWFVDCAHHGGARAVSGPPPVAMIGTPC
ncbi:CoA transferase [Nocardia canadensis]|uniref:CoA transferase n=1 Tax=Nocardia canadensis TaxID=3065238 RepID=UPI00292D3486|nr:CoA transferase [Nocardia canadensis]